jgi:hypothetical protein
MYFCTLYVTCTTAGDETYNSSFGLQIAKYIQFSKSNSNFLWTTNNLRKKYISEIICSQIMNKLCSFSH